MLSIKTEGKRITDVLKWEEDDRFSREVIVIAENQTLVIGSVIGRNGTQGVEYDAVPGTPATTAAVAGNTGNGVLGAVTVASPARPGVYRLTITAASANAGSFNVEDPDGNLVGTGTVAVAFAEGGLSFTLADGSTDFGVGDAFTITVPEAGGTGYGILLDNVTTGAGETKKAVALVRHAKFAPSGLVWKAGLTTDQKNAALAAFANNNLLPVVEVL